MTSLPVIYVLCACAAMTSLISAHGPSSMHPSLLGPVGKMRAPAIRPTPVGLKIKPIGKNLWVAKKFNPVNRRWISSVVNSHQLASLKKKLAVHNARQFHWARKLSNRARFVPAIGAGGVLGRRLNPVRPFHRLTGPTTPIVRNGVSYGQRQLRIFNGQGPRPWNSLSNFPYSVSRLAFDDDNFERIDDTFDDRFDEGFNSDDFRVGSGGEERWDDDRRWDDMDDRLEGRRSELWNGVDKMFDNVINTEIMDNNDISLDDLDLSTVIRGLQMQSDIAIQSRSSTPVLRPDLVTTNDIRNNILPTPVQGSPAVPEGMPNNSFDDVKDSVKNTVDATRDQKPDFSRVPVERELGVLGLHGLMDSPRLVPASAIIGIGGDTRLVDSLTHNHKTTQGVGGGIPVNLGSSGVPDSSSGSLDGMVFLSGSKSDRLMNIIRGATHRGGALSGHGHGHGLIDVHLDSSQPIADLIGPDSPLQTDGNMFALLGIDPQTMEMKASKVSQIPVSSTNVPDHPPPILLPNRTSKSDDSINTISKASNISPKAKETVLEATAPTNMDSRVSRGIDMTNKVLEDLAAIALFKQMDMR